MSHDQQLFQNESQVLSMNENKGSYSPQFKEEGHSNIELSDSRHHDVPNSNLNIQNNIKTSDSGESLSSFIESTYSSLELTKGRPPLNIRSIFWSCAINILLPFVNGMMLGFGEIFAHELGFHWGWSAARVSIYCVNCK